MKHEDGAVFMIYDLDGVPLGELGEDEGYEVWPDGVRGWSDTLDCTVEPYDERTLEENVKFARHVNKHAVVMRIA